MRLIFLTTHEIDSSEKYFDFSSDFFQTLLYELFWPFKEFKNKKLMISLIWKLVGKKVKNFLKNRHDDVIHEVTTKMKYFWFFFKFLPV